MTNLIGQSLGRYHILEQLGEGGMATVYKAYDTRLEADVAVKVIRTENLAPSVLERALKRFEREAKALARLTHPNIVKVTDFGEHDGKPYLVLEYLPGGTLKNRLGKPMQWQIAMQLLLPIARALDYAHRQNMIHRDVKPSNILITADGEPMLTDFGIAKVLDLEETADLTGTGMGIGTPEYMAPEQWTGQSSPQSDLYSLGVVLYEMITGRKPYTAQTPAAILLKQATEPLPGPSELVNDLPDKVEKTLIKALARDPKDRYKNIGDFAKAIESSFKSGSSFAEHPKRKPAPKPTERILNTLVTAEQDWEETKTSQSIPLLKQASQANKIIQYAAIAAIVVVLGLLAWNIQSGNATTSVEYPQSAADTATDIEDLIDVEAATEDAPVEQASTIKHYDTSPAMMINVEKKYFATFEMEKGGTFVVELYPDKAPITVNNFVFLAREGFFDGVTFHRVLEDFMAQGGDPTGTGGGGPGYHFVNEDSDLTFDKEGVVAMANAGRDTNGSQFFITFGPAEFLNGGYTIFGQVIEGMDVVNGITRRDPNLSPNFTGDVIKSITITEE